MIKILNTKTLLTNHQSSARRKGFTLIELLVDIVIIGFLLTVVFVVFTNSRSKTRDVKRVANINQIQKGLELYFNSQGAYPNPGEINLELGTDNYDVLCFGASAAGFKGDIGDCGANAILYIDHIPKAFRVVSTNCPVDGNDTYSYTGATNNYTISFCLEKKVRDLGPGPCTASSGKITCP